MAQDAEALLSKLNKDPFLSPFLADQFDEEAFVRSVVRTVRFFCFASTGFPLRWPITPAAALPNPSIPKLTPSAPRPPPPPPSPPRTPP